MQGGGHVDTGEIIVGAFEADVFRGGVRADSLKKGRETNAAPLADGAPAFDTGVTRDPLLVVARGKKLQRVLPISASKSEERIVKIP
jgi:hypothetical protein